MRLNLRNFSLLLLSLFLALSTSSSLLAQSGGGGDAGGGGGDDDGDIPPVAGIEIDATGVLHIQNVDRGLLMEQRRAALGSSPNSDSVQSKLRKVSLTRLDRALARRLEKGEKATREMLGLAGLTRIEYAFFYPESGDIVLAGPAEKTIVDASGRLVGIVTGKPVVRLEDVVVALRAYAPTKDSAKAIGCSIDPTAEGLRQMQQFLASLGGNVGNRNPQWIASTLKDNLGMQNVSVHGIPDDTHFAQVLVEADYRMKMVGIGLERMGIPMKSWVDRASSNGNANSLQRWYFTSNYDAVKVSPDQTAMKLEGQGVKLVGASELVSAQGQRSGNQKMDRASKQFVDEFTAKFEDIAEVSPVFHEMRNLFDVSVVAAFIQDRRWCEFAGWDLGVFASEDSFSVEGKPAPKQVESAVNAIWKGGRLMTPIGGGVEISGRRVINSEVTREDAGVDAAPAAPRNLTASQWWWD